MLNHRIQTKHKHADGQLRQLGSTVLTCVGSLIVRFVENDIFSTLWKVYFVTFAVRHLVACQTDESFVEKALVQIIDIILSIF